MESTGNLTTASGSLPIAYNEQFPPGYATMNGTVNFTFPQTVTLGQTASISASAQATWNNSGLGFGRPTSIDISDGIGPDGLDDKGSFANGTTSAQVNWSDSVAVPTGPGSVTLPTVTVTVDGKEDKIITLTASYQIALGQLAVTEQPPEEVLPGDPFAVAISAIGSNGKVDTNFNGPVTITLAAIPTTGATLGGTATVTAKNGVATFDDLSVADLGNGYTLQASATALVPVTTAAFDVVGQVSLTWTGKVSELWSNENNWVNENGDPEAPSGQGDDLDFPAGVKSALTPSTISPALRSARYRSKPATN